MCRFDCVIWLDVKRTGEFWQPVKNCIDKNTDYLHLPHVLNANAPLRNYNPNIESDSGKKCVAIFT